MLIAVLDAGVHPIPITNISGYVFRAPFVIAVNSIGGIQVRAVRIEIGVFPLKKFF
jgi:hypothetical protein